MNTPSCPPALRTATLASGVGASSEASLAWTRVLLPCLWPALAAHLPDTRSHECGPLYGLPVLPFKRI